MGKKKEGTSLLMLLDDTGTVEVLYSGQVEAVEVAHVSNAADYRRTVKQLVTMGYRVVKISQCYRRNKKTEAGIARKG